MMLTLMVTSKGVAAVPRASLVILAGTLASFGLPLEAVAVILGVDELMDMARTTVNLIGNCLATCVMARWEGEFDDNATGILPGEENRLRPARRPTDAGSGTRPEGGRATSHPPSSQLLAIAPPLPDVHTRHPRAARGFQADVGVLEDHASRGRDAEPPGRFQEHVRLRLVPRRVLGHHHRVEPVADGEAVERPRDRVAVAAARDRDRQLARDRPRRWRSPARSSVTASRCVRNACSFS